MLEFENLDLDLDEDFPSGPFHKINFLGNSQVSSKGEDKVEGRIISGEGIIGQKTRQNPTEYEVNEVVQTSLDCLGRNDVVRDRPAGNESKSFSKGSNPMNGVNNEINAAKRVLTQRKFPGPAGLLPDTPLNALSEVNFIVDSSYEDITSKCEKDSVILCSQSSSVFAESSYKKLSNDFGLNEGSCNLNKYTIDWVKKKALNKTLCGKKIPFLAVVLHHLDHSTPDPILTLKDSTGEIYGSLHREVWSQWGEKLHPGAALALRQVGVLVTGMTRRQVYLNITMNNIVTIYSYSDEEMVNTDVINKVTNEELMTSSKESHCDTSNIEKDSPVQLFSFIGGNKSKDLMYPHSKSDNSNKRYSFNDSNLSRNKLMVDKSANSMRSTVPHNMSSGLNVKGRSNVTHKDENIPNCDSSGKELNCDIQALSGIKSNHSVGRKNTFEDNCLSKTFFEAWKYEEMSNSLKHEVSRKRKIDSDNVIPSSALHPEHISKKSLVPKVGIQSQLNSTLGNRPLSQAESQIVEEVLDGIDFDDF